MWNVTLLIAAAPPRPLPISFIACDARSSGGYGCSKIRPRRVSETPTKVGNERKSETSCVLVSFTKPRFEVSPTAMVPQSDSTGIRVIL